MSVADVAESGVRRFDDFQQRHWWLAHPLAMIRKYADDRGSAFAGLVTFQMFLGMLPLLVVGLTVSGILLSGSADLRQAALESAFAQFPVVGERIRDDVSALEADSIWVVVSVVALLWTAAGIYHSLQLALNQVWNVEGVDRQGFVSRHVRALVLFVLVALAAVGTGALRRVAMPSPTDRGVLLAVISASVSVLMASGLLFLVFRIVVSPAVPKGRLVPAAVLAGLFWELLQRLGSWIVADQLSQAQDLYGAIGFVVAILLWINLLARSAILANEWAVVSWDRLWPRRLAQPPLSAADRDVLVRLARNERRRPEERIQVSFDDGGENEAERDEADRGENGAEGDEADSGEP